MVCPITQGDHKKVSGTATAKLQPTKKSTSEETEDCQCILKMQNMNSVLAAITLFDYRITGRKCDITGFYYSQTMPTTPTITAIKHS